MNDRSDKYFEAAKLLLNNRHYNSSTALFYYAAFLRMRYVLNNAQTNPITYDSQNPINDSVHSRVRTEFKNHLKMQSDIEHFDDVFGQLQELREKADYSDNCVSEIECATAQELAGRIINYFAKKIPIIDK